MLKEIPNKPNHKIVGYTKRSILTTSNDIIDVYEPVYERIIPLGTVVMLEAHRNPYYLISDTTAISILGQEHTITSLKVEVADSYTILLFHKLLQDQGFEIENGKCVKIATWWQPVYTLEKGFIPQERKKPHSEYERFVKWQEAFSTRDECANWCDAINNFLDRGYAKV